jgi:hypothetical protein
MGGVSFSPSPGTGEISADPEFEDPDFHLSEDSPCVDAGHPGAMYNDQDGSRNDMGAYGGLLSFTGLGSYSGSGFIFTSIGKIPTSEITMDPSDLSFGLANVSDKIATDYKIHKYTDSPFGGRLWLHGLFGDLDNVSYYQILVGKWNGSTPPDPSDYVTLNDQLTKVYYTVKSDGTVTHKYVSLGPKTLSGIPDVYQLTKTGWWSHLDLRMIWNTNSWENGKYTLKYKAYSTVSVLPVETIAPVILPEKDFDKLTIIVNNTRPEVEIHRVMYDSGIEIPECGIITLSNSGENLKFEITAWHPDGYLKNYRIRALYGSNKTLGYVVNDQYVGSNDSSPPIWYGVDPLEINSADAPPDQLAPWVTCGYQFRLQAWSRTTDGYHYIRYREFNDQYYIEIDTGVTPEPTPEPTPGPTPITEYGDCNSDGQVDIVDAFLTARYYVGYDVGPAFDPIAADVNCDQVVDIVDALLVAQYYVGLITSFPCDNI